MAKKETTVEKMALAAALDLVVEKPSEKQVNEAMQDKAFEALVLDVAERFGKAGSKARKPEDWSGLVEKDEFKLLPYAPRSGLVGESPWPKIAGHSTYPMTPCLRREEADAVYKWRKAHEGMGTPTGRRSKVLPIGEEVALVKDYQQDLMDLKAVREAGLADVADRMALKVSLPETPRLSELFGDYAEACLIGERKVSIGWLMCRNSEGKASDKPDADIATLMADGYFPSITKPMLDEKVNALKDAGLDVTGMIEGWL